MEPLKQNKHFSTSIIQYTYQVSLLVSGCLVKLVDTEEANKIEAIHKSTDICANKLAGFAGWTSGRSRSKKYHITSF